MDEYLQEVVLRRGGSAEEGASELTVRLRELPLADGVHGSTGNMLWHSCVVLARELLRRPDLIRGKRIVELGAGCGLLGIAAASLAGYALLTDGDEEAADNLAHNVRLNEHVWRSRGDESPGCEVHTRCLSWQDAVDSPMFALEEERADVAMGSDIIYGHWGDDVAKAMLSMLRAGGLILLASSEDRRSGIPAFQRHLRERGFRVEETKMINPLGTFRIYECRARHAGEPEEDPEVCERVESEPSEDSVRLAGPGASAAVAAVPSG